MSNRNEWTAPLVTQGRVEMNKHDRGTQQVQRWCCCEVCCVCADINEEKITFGIAIYFLSDSLRLRSQGSGAIQGEGSGDPRRV